MARKPLIPSATDPQFPQKVEEWIRRVSGLTKGYDGERLVTLNEVKRLAGSGTSAASSSSSSGGGGSSGGVATIPTDLAAEWNGNAGCVVVSWTLPTYSGHQRTELRVSTTGDINDSVKLESVDASQYLDFDGTPGVERTYFARHIGSSGQSVFSSGVSATPQNIAPATPTDPTGLIVFWTPGIKGTLVKWDVPTYSGHLRTEVWVSTTGNVNDATLKFSSDDTQIVDYEYTYDVERFYHIRHIGEAGSSGYVVDSATPSQALPNIMVAGTITNTTEIDIPVNLIGASDGKVKIHVSGFYRSKEN